MGLDSNLAALMRNTVSWEAYAGRDEFGGESYAAPVPLACHVEENVVAQRTPDGETLLSRQCVYLDGTDGQVQGFTLKDRFTVPGVAGGQPSQPVAISPVYGPDGSAWLVAVTL